MKKLEIIHMDDGSFRLFTVEISREGEAEGPRLYFGTGAGLFSLEALVKEWAVYECGLDPEPPAPSRTWRGLSGFFSRLWRDRIVPALLITVMLGIIALVWYLDHVRFVW